MIKENNAAARLYEILLDLKGLPQNPPLLQGWAKVFNVDPPDAAIVYSNLVRLDDSLSDIGRDIRLQDVDPDIYLQHFPKIRTLLSYPNLQTHLSQHVALFGEEVLTSLQFCSEKLSRSAPERIIPKEVLVSVAAQVDELTTQLASSELNKQLKAHGRCTGHIEQRALHLPAQPPPQPHKFDQIHV